MELVQDAHNTQEVRRALKLVAPLQIVWPTEVDCARALSDFTVYHLSHGLGLLDSIIAACAVGLSATSYTFNDKHHRVVPGLVIASHIRGKLWLGSVPGKRGRKWVGSGSEVFVVKCCP